MSTTTSDAMKIQSIIAPGEPSVDRHEEDADSDHEDEITQSGDEGDELEEVDPDPDHDSESESSTPASSPSTSTDPKPSHTLEDAIYFATEARLRTVLTKICRDNAICKFLASKELLVENPNAPVGQVGVKRKAYEMCHQCDEEYDVVVNETHKKLCTYHPGEKEVEDDHDLWADLWPDDGSPEDFIDDPDMAEGFRWSCCEKPGDADGCVTTKHRPLNSKRFKHA